MSLPQLDRRSFLASAATSAAPLVAPAVVPPFLRLFSDDTAAENNQPPRPPLAPPAAGDDQGKISPRMTLSQFFERWYLPQVLVQEKRAKPSTIARNRQTIGWWVRLTGDPPLCCIDRETIFERFIGGLRGAQYSRSAGVAAKVYAVSETTQATHINQLRAVYFRTGPEKADPKRPAAGLLDEIIHIVVPAPADKHVKPSFDVTQARRVYASCDVMTDFGLGGVRPGGHGYVTDRGDGGPGAANRWRSLLAGFYYTGLRFGAMAALRWSWLTTIKGQAFFNIPAAAMKGGKHGLVKFVHPHWLMLLGKTRSVSSSDLVYPWLSEFSHSHLLHRHVYLQRSAGINAPLEFHAWRRTHGDLMLDLGLSAVEALGSLALGHRDPTVLRKHYVEVEPKFIRRLPLLDPDWHEPPPADPNQRSLF